MVGRINALKLRRMIAGIKQHELAEAAGMSESTLSKMETGRRYPTEEEARKLAKKLRCKPERLMDLEDVVVP